MKIKSDGSPYHLENLLREVVIDEGCLQSQVTWCIDAVSFVLRWFRCRLADGQQVKFRVVPLVEEKFISDSLNDYVPRIAGSGTAHEGGQDGIGGKHIPRRFGKLKKQK